MAAISPIRIKGDWDDGYALDSHIVKSRLIGYDEHGHARWDTVRTELGELLYQLKYGGDKSALEPIVSTVSTFLESRKWQVDIVVPVPPSIARHFQPVAVLAEGLAKALKIESCQNCMKKIKNTPGLKNVSDFNERKKLLDGAFEVNRPMIQGKRVLLLDDLYDSGATMNTVSSALKHSGGAATVYALAITKTRTLQ